MGTFRRFAGKPSQLYTLAKKPILPTMSGIEQNGDNVVDDSASMRLAALSVHYLATTFMEEVIEAGLNKDSTVYQVENLDDDEPGVIRRKGAAINCPIDGKKGAAYVHCVGHDDEDNVGVATHMLSYSWRYASQFLLVYAGIGPLQTCIFTDNFVLPPVELHDPDTQSVILLTLW